MIPQGHQARRRAADVALHLELDRGPDAPAAARAAVSGLCEQAGLSRSRSRCQTLLLLVSEVVTNAVLHSDAPPSTPITFSAHARDERVRVEVADGGSGFKVPDVTRPSGGWGLRLVQDEAASWGVDVAGCTRVWFELSIAV